MFIWGIRGLKYEVTSYNLKFIYNFYLNLGTSQTHNNIISSTQNNLDYFIFHDSKIFDQATLGTKQYKQLFTKGFGERQVTPSVIAKSYILRKYEYTSHILTI